MVWFADFQGSGLFGISPAFQWLAPPSGRFVFRFDKGKLRLKNESRKTKMRKLSTGMQIPCGQHWITPSKGQIRRCCHSTDSFISANSSISERSAAIPLCQKAQAQGVELDEARSILLIICAGIVFERHMPFGIERVG